MISATLKTAIRTALAETDIPARDLVRASRKSHYGTPGGEIGQMAWDRYLGASYGDHLHNEALHTLPGWPECECWGCGCTEPATQTDDGGVPVCDDCSSYTLDDDGQVVCSNMDVCEECGESRLSDALDAGGNSTVRLTGCACERAAAIAEEDRDEDGEWAVVDMDGRIESRHASEAGANAYTSHAGERFANHLIDTHQAGSGAYQPRSVCHIPCGIVRGGQWSTSWYSPDCEHISQDKE